MASNDFFKSFFKILKKITTIRNKFVFVIKNVPTDEKKMNFFMNFFLFNSANTFIFAEIKFNLFDLINNYQLMKIRNLSI